MKPGKETHAARDPRVGQACSKLTGAMHQMATFMLNIIYGPSTSKYELNYIYGISEVVFALLKIHINIIYFLYCQK